MTETQFESGRCPDVEHLIASLPEQVRDLATRRELSIMVNGADVSTLQGGDTKLTDGDEVVLLPFAHGGCA